MDECAAHQMVPYGPGLRGRHFLGDVERCSVCGTFLYANGEPLPKNAEPRPYPAGLPTAWIYVGNEQPHTD